MPAPPSSLAWLPPSARSRRILALALPICGAMVSQNVLNLVDAAMVGHLGDGALGGVGLGSMLNFLTSAIVLGLGAGVQTMAARRVGEGRRAVAAHPLNGGLLLALGLALPWSALLIAGAPLYFPLLSDDPAVLAAGTPYLQARLAAMVAMAMNFCFRGFWNAVDRPTLYMKTLIVMHTVNVLLNWVLIFGNLGAPELGAAGAGIASALSTAFGTGMYFALGFRHARDAGFLHGIPDRETLAGMWRLSIPAGLQQLFFAAGMVAFLAIVARIGTAELAATHVIIQLLLVGVLPGLGFGLASASLVGQALGRGEPEDAARWGWEVTRLAVTAVFVLSLPAMLRPEAILGVFLHEPETLAVAVLPLRLVAVFIALDTVGSVLMNSLIGAGDTRRVMVVATALQWGLFLPLAYVVGPLLGFGLTAVFGANVAYRQLQSLTFAALWRQGRWRHIAV